jgi:hypothetical protein
MPALEAKSASYYMGTGGCGPMIEAPGPEACHLPSYSADVKHSSLLHMPAGRIQRQLYFYEICGSHRGTSGNPSRLPCRAMSVGKYS